MSRKRSPLAEWLREQRDEDMRGIYVETAALAGNMTAYLRGRLRYGLLNNALAVSIYLLEFIALRRTYVSRHLMTAFAVHVACVLSVALWWGALDHMRVEIREQRMLRGWRALSLAIERWMSAAVFLGAGVALLSVIALGVVAWRAPRWTPVALYASACGIRLAISLVIRTYHSCVYALSRVRRPVWSMRVADAVGLVVLLASTSVHTHASVQAARVVVATLASALVSAFFVRRAWRRLDLPAPRLAFVRPLRAILGSARSSLGGFVVASLGGAILQGAHVLALFTMVLFLAAGGFYQRSTLLYVVSPFLAAAASWPLVLYFDCFRLARRIADDGVRQRLLAHMRIVAPIIGTITGALAIAVVHLVHFEASGAPLLFVIPLAMACSAFTVEQMADFSSGRYLASVVRILPLAAVPFAVSGARRVVPAWSADHVAFSMVVVAVALGAWSRRSSGIRRPLRADKPIPLASWLAELAASASGSLGMATMARTPVGPNAQTAAQELASRLCARGSVVTIVGGRVLWFGFGGTLAEIAVLSGGTATRLELHAYHAFSDALERVRAWVLPSSASAGDGELEALFRDLCPEGHVLDVDAAHDVTLTVPEQCAVYRAAADLVTGRRPRTRPREHEVAPYAPEGSVRTIFVLPRTVPKEKRTAFGASILERTLRGVEDALHRAKR
jgi:hypothetical protein